MKASRFAFLLGVMLVGAMLALPQSASADHFAGSALKIYSKGYTHIDLGYYFEKAKDIFFGDEFIRKHPKAAMVREFINTMGYFAISDYEVESRIAQGRIWTRETIYLNDEHPDSLIYRIVQLPDRRFKIGSLLTDDDYVALIAVNNFKEKGKLIFEHILKTMSELPRGDEGARKMKQMMGMLQMIQLKPEIIEALGNEIDIVLFEVPDITKPVNGPQDVNAAILVPVADYEQTKKLIGMVGGFAGFDLRKPSFCSTEWRFYDVAGSGVGLGLSHEWLVLATNYKWFARYARMSQTQMHEDLPSGNCFIRINAQKLYDQLGRPALTAARSEYPRLADEAIAYFFDITPDTDFGEIKCLIQFHGDRAVSTFEMDDEVVSGLLFFLCAGLETAAGQELQRQREWKEKWERRRKQKKEPKLPSGKEFKPSVPF